MWLSCLKEQWEPWIGEVLPLERDPTNPEESNAVTVNNASGTVGHVPFNLASVMSAFQRKSTNKRMIDVAGNKFDPGACYELEIPYKYHFFGSTLYIERLKIIVDKQHSDVLL